jgi:hypothetical protein
VFFGGLFGGWEVRWRYLVILAGGVALPGLLQVSQANTTGFIMAGRYLLPLLAGLPLLAAWTLERLLLDAGQTRTLIRAFVVFLLPVHLALLVFTMVRWQRGLPENAGTGWFNPLAGDWHPPTGSVLPLVLMAIGLLGTGALFWRVRGQARPTDKPADGAPAAIPGQLERTEPMPTWAGSRAPGADPAPTER